MHATVGKRAAGDKRTCFWMAIYLIKSKNGLDLDPNRFLFL